MLTLQNLANATHLAITVEGIERQLLQVLAFDAIEAIDSEYIAEITLVTDHLRYDITKLLNKNAYLSYTQDGSRGIHGQIQLVKRCAVGTEYALFKIILAPRFYHLYHEVNQRAFIGKSVIDIINTLLAEKGYQSGVDFEFKLKDQSVYLPREFCCQYDESTAHFIHRLCEEEGLHLRYEHTTDNHKLIISDANPFFGKLTNAFEYKSDTGFSADYPVFKKFDINLNSATTSASYRNYNFTNQKIPTGKASTAENSNPNSPQKQANGIEPSLEHYDYPQHHTNQKQGERYAKLRLEQLRTHHIEAEAYTDIPDLHAGYYFTVEGYPAIDTLNTQGRWLITELYHQGRQPQVLGEHGDVTHNTALIGASLLFNYYLAPIHAALQFPFEGFKQCYRNTLIAIPQETIYRPEPRHPKQRVLGSQTAIVTGASGEEIYTDEYGRIKVLFHWDRINPNNENSSHWIRVASNWAGNQYGTVVIPRVGMEVKIDFLEGDIDNPIVTGALHNGINKVPYELPANKTRSVFKTSSSKGGIGSNELRIEDKAGAEQIFVQAQKDFDQLTKHNHIVQVNNNSHLQVQNEHSETIVGNSYQKQQSEEHHLTQLDRKTQILGNDYKQVVMAEHETIGTIKTTQAGMEIHLKSGLQTIIDGGLSLTLKAGGQHIVLNPTGIWMTMPVFTGGVPMEGTPAAPIPPMTKQYGVTGTTSKAVNLQPASLPKEQPEIIKQLKFIIRPMAGVAGYSKEPYKLYADGNLLQKGVTDEEGAIYFKHIPSIKKYEVELPLNDHRFTLLLNDQADHLNEADLLGLEGYSCFEHTSQTNKLANQTDYRLKARNPAWQPQLIEEKDVE